MPSPYLHIQDKVNQEIISLFSTPAKKYYYAFSEFSQYLTCNFLTCPMTIGHTFLLQWMELTGKIVLIYATSGSMIFHLNGFEIIYQFDSWFHSTAIFRIW
uniref:Uncharacterized protein n=1 Tax=Sphaerodactylus townsendi TaxID=933632 RepID=A0ACB8F3P1_9SAUR